MRVVNTKILLNTTLSFMMLLLLVFSDSFEVLGLQNTAAKLDVFNGHQERFQGYIPHLHNQLILNRDTLSYKLPKSSLQS